ncbi:MAG: SdrD B-like domain-containing protein, partial [Candidatus Kariarchaeaceae archaeon]
TIKDPGSYRIFEILKPGWSATNPTISDIAGLVLGYDLGLVESGDSYDNMNFWNFKWVTISGYKYLDYDDDKPIDKPLDGWAIELHDNGGVIATATTGDGLWADGYYEFLIKYPGTYFVKEILKVGWTQTWPTEPDDFHTVTVPSDENLDALNFWNKIEARTWISDTSEDRNVVTDFRIVFTPDDPHAGTYKISSTNPGGFYFNILNTAGQNDGTMVYKLPVEFTYRGGNPIHVYIWRDHNNNGQIDYWGELEVIPKKDLDIIRGDHTGNITITSDIDPLAFILYTIHITFELKGDGGFTKSDVTAFNSEKYYFNATYYDPSEELIWFSETMLKPHSKWSNLLGPSLYGITIDQTNDNEALAGITFNLYDSNGKRVKFITTDEDGDYLFDKLKIGAYKLEIRIPLEVFLEDEESDLLITITVVIEIQKGNFISINVIITEEGSTTSIEGNSQPAPVYTNIGPDPWTVDSDGDGLTDGAEINTYWTDPTNVDTDGDGLSDSEEVNTHLTEPLNVDTDSDGLTDYEEVNSFSTDPLNADTDGDSLSDGDEVLNGTDPLVPEPEEEEEPTRTIVSETTNTTTFTKEESSETTIGVETETEVEIETDESKDKDSPGWTLIVTLTSLFVIPFTRRKWKHRK